MASVTLLIVEFLGSFALALYLLFYFKAPQVKADVCLTVVSTWMFGIMGVLLLPYDLSVAIVEERTSTALAVLWEFTYWTTFVLAWVLLPLQLEYHASGYFTRHEKFKDAMWANIYFFGTIGALLLFLALYAMATRGMSAGDVTNLAMAIGNMYGILLLVGLMGSGLIALPRRLWQLSFPDAELARLYYTAGAVESDFNDARYQLEDCEDAVAEALAAPRNRHLEEADDIARYLEAVNDLVLNFDFSRRSTTNKMVRGSARKSGRRADADTCRGAGAGTESNGEQVGAGEGDRPTTPELMLGDDGPTVVASVVTLHAKVKSAQVRVRACERRWAVLLRRVSVIRHSLGESTDEESAIAMTTFGGSGAGTRAKSDSWSDMEMPTSSGEGAPVLVRIMEGALMLLWQIQNLCGCLANGILASPYTKTSRVLMRCAAVICAFGSLIVLYSQFVVAMNMDSIVGVCLSSLRDSSVGVQLISFFALAYMGLCSFFSLFTLKIGWYFTLQGPHQSPSSSLIFNAEIFSRLQFSLGYSFLLSLQDNVDANRAAFQSVVRRMTVLPSFQVYLPLVTVVVAAATFFHFWGRVLNMLRMCGIDMAGESEELGTSAMGVALAWGMEPSRHSARGGEPLSANDEEFLSRVERGKKLVALEIRRAARGMTAVAGVARGTVQGSPVGDARGRRPFMPVPSDAWDEGSVSSVGTLSRGEDTFSPKTTRLQLNPLHFQDEDDDDDDGGDGANNCDIGSGVPDKTDGARDASRGREYDEDDYGIASFDFAVPEDDGSDSNDEEAGWSRADADALKRINLSIQEPEEGGRQEYMGRYS